MITNAEYNNIVGIVMNQTLLRRQIRAAPDALSTDSPNPATQ